MSEQVKNKVIVATTHALRVLDGNEKERFKFSGTFMYAMSKNIRRLTEITEDLEKSRQALVRKHDLGKKKNEKGQIVKDDVDVLQRFQDEYDALMDQESEVVVTKFKLGELNLETNNIPISALAALGWLILE